MVHMKAVFWMMRHAKRKDGEDAITPEGAYQTWHFARQTLSGTNLVAAFSSDQYRTYATASVALRALGLHGYIPLQQQPYLGYRWLENAGLPDFSEERAVRAMQASHTGPYMVWDWFIHWPLAFAFRERYLAFFYRVMSEGYDWQVSGRCLEFLIVGHDPFISFACADPKTTPALDHSDLLKNTVRMSAPGCVEVVSTKYYPVSRSQDR